MPSARTPWIVSLLVLGFAALVSRPPDSEEATPRHDERSFTIHLDAAPGQVFPLFDPLGEREWAPGWDPKMLFPADGSSPARPVTKMARKSGLSRATTRETASSVM